jgi:predicted Zn-dependent protease
MGVGSTHRRISAQPEEDPMSSRQHYSLAAIAALFSLSVIACGDEAKPTDASPTTVTSVSASTPTAPATGAKAVVTAVAVSARYEDGEAAYRAGRYGDAEAIFDAYTARKPDNVFGHYMAGLSAWKAGDLARASQSFDRALAIDSTHVKSLLNSARVYFELGKADSARERVERALAIDSTDVDGLRLYARALNNTGDVPGAIDAYRNVLVHDEQDAWSMNNLGLIYIEQGNYEDAIAPLARAVQLRDNAPVFHNNLGIALEGSRHYAAARDQFDRTLQVDSTYGKAAVSLERMRGLAGDAAADDVDLGEKAAEFVQYVRMWKNVVPMDSVERQAPSADSVSP